MRDLYAALLRLRVEIGRHEAEPAYDEARGWLNVRRGAHEIVGNFARDERHVPVDGHEIVLATHDGARIEDSYLVLPALAGAVVR